MPSHLLTPTATIRSNPYASDMVKSLGTTFIDLMYTVD